jgi:hypothetical protein
LLKFADLGFKSNFVATNEFLESFVCFNLTFLDQKLWDLGFCDVLLTKFYAKNVTFLTKLSLIKKL